MAVDRLTNSVAALYHRCRNERMPELPGADPSYQSPILGKPARELTPSDIFGHVQPAFCLLDPTLKSQAVRFILPRWCELLSWRSSELDDEAERVLFVADEFGESEGMVLANAMQSARWRTWRPEIVDAFTHWLDAWWEACLAYPVRGSGGWTRWNWGLSEARCAYLCLKMIAKVGEDVKRYLTAWEDTPGLAAVRQLVVWVDDEWESICRKGHLRCFEDYSPTAEAECRTWLTGQGPVTMLDRAVLLDGVEPYLDVLATAAERLSWLRDSSQLRRQ
jgi:hypothetical protein